MRTKIFLFFALACGLLEAQNNLTSTAIQRYFNPVRRNLEAAADVMPAEKYGFRLTEGQMTFAEWLNHSSERNYTDCATLKSEPDPWAGKKIAFTEKADVAKTLKDSLTYCVSAIEGIDDQKVLSTPQMSYSFLHIMVHNNEIYGNLAGYLRANGIVPPSTAARTGQQKGTKK